MRCVVAHTVDLWQLTSGKRSTLETCTGDTFQMCCAKCSTPTAILGNVPMHSMRLGKLNALALSIKMTQRTFYDRSGFEFPVRSFIPTRWVGIVDVPVHVDCMCGGTLTLGSSLKDALNFFRAKPSICTSRSLGPGSQPGLRARTLAQTNIQFSSRRCRPMGREASMNLISSGMHKQAELMHKWPNESRCRRYPEYG